MSLYPEAVNLRKLFGQGTKPLYESGVSVTESSVLKSQPLL
nr:MAG TPA: hypothetical protein [Caudoviricetes sp.]